MKLSLQTRNVLYKVMKITFGQIIIAMILSGICYAKGSYGQKILEKKISISIQNQSLDKALQDLGKIADIKFIYSKSIVETGQLISISASHDRLGDVLNKMLVGNGIQFSLINDLFVLSKTHGPDAVIISGDRPGTGNDEQQGIPVKGQVTDEKGEPLIGVAVMVKGSSNGTSTNTEGRYTLNVPDGNAILVFKYIGYIPREVSVNSQTVVNVSLTPEPKGLNEVVVVGYGTQSRHKLTAAVSSVSGEDLNRRVATTPVALLQGQLPGLQVTQGSGEPGNEGIQLTIRGIGTFSGSGPSVASGTSNAVTSSNTAGSNPLIIVNGLPGSIDVLNPNDIESISVLKDAASTAIYGSRGANGVIVVKTKRGKSGNFTVQYNYNYGISNATKLPDLITNSATYMQLSNEARTNSSLAPLYTQQQIDLYQNATDRVKYPNHNWLNDVFRTAHTQNHYLNMSGGRENTNYSVSFGVTKQPGVMTGFDYKKYTFALGLTSKVNNRITIGTDVQARYGNKAAPQNGATDQFLSTLAQSPLYPAQAADGSYIKKAYSNELGNKNPVAMVKEDIRTYTSDYYIQGNLSLDVDLFKGLTWQNKGGVNYDASKYSTFIPVTPSFYYSDMSPAGNLGSGTPGLTAGRADNVYAVFYSQLSYKTSFGNHNLSAFAGFQEEQNTVGYLDAYRTQFATNALHELNAGPLDGQTNNGTSAQWAMRSFYGNVNYDYNDKYLLGISVRDDGTSRLPSYSRYGLFYSFSGAWRVSKENFLKNVSWINDMKIRGSWGQLGNQNTDTYPYQPALTSANYAFGAVTSGFIANSLVDPNLTWETTRTFDVGIDITAFNKLTITADWFNKYSFDILRGSQVPLYVGLNAPIINDGALRNKGIEVAMQYNDRIGKDFSFNVGVNFQTYRNKLEKYGSKDITEKSGTIREEGHELDAYYMYIWDGIFQSQQEIDNSPVQPVTPTPGDLKIKDVNGDGKIDANDRTYVGGRYPSFQYAANLGASWKGIDFSAQFYGSQGQKAYVTGWGIEPFKQGSPPTTDWINRWTPDHHSNTMPKIYSSDGYAPVQNYVSTYFLKNASFLRLKSLQAGYTFPAHILSKLTAKSLRIYVAADNVFTITKYPGLDPERAGDGVYVSYPQNRTITFGASIQL